MLSIELAYDPVIPLLGTHPEELKTRSHKNLRINVPVSILFNNPNFKCPSADEWLSPVVHPYVVVHKKEQSTDPGLDTAGPRTLHSVRETQLQRPRIV